MSEQWAVYVTQIEGSAASIFLDLGLKYTEPDKARPHLGTVTIAMNNPNWNGLTSKEEFDNLEAIDSLIVQTATDNDALFVGRVSTQGQWEFHFYMAEPEPFDSWVRQAMAGFPAYQFSVDILEDPNMSLYLDTLYPDAAGLQSAANNQLVCKLAKEGDDLTQPRPVDHFAYFSRRESREEMARWAETEGFTYTYSMAEGEERPWQIEMVKIHPVDLATVDAITRDLQSRCRELGGIYDGWASPLAKPNRPPAWWKKLTGGR